MGLKRVSHSCLMEAKTKPALTLGTSHHGKTGLGNELFPGTFYKAAPAPRDMVGLQLLAGKMHVRDETAKRKPAKCQGSEMCQSLGNAT